MNTSTTDGPENQVDIRQRYENALDNLVAKLRKDHTILAALLVGSLSYDSVWEKSDIDLMLITHETKLLQSSFGLVEDDINIHAYLYPRSEFKRALEGAVQSSFLHSMLMKGRMLYTHDSTLAEMFENRLHLGARDREIQLLRYATWILPALAKAEKWLRVRQDVEYSFFWIMKTLDGLAAVETLLNGEITGREVILQALKHNPAMFKQVYTDLIRQEKTLETINAALLTIQNYLRDRVPILFKPIFDYLSEAEGFRSATEISYYFRHHMNLDGIDMACEWLADEQYIQKVATPVHLTDRSRVEVEEAAYYYDPDH